MVIANTKNFLGAGHHQIKLSLGDHDLRFLFCFPPSRDAKKRQKMLTSTYAALPYAVCVLAWIFIASYKTINETPSGN